MADYKILIAEDEPDLRSLMAIRLEKSGYKVVVASDGEEAMIKAKQENPDMIFLDIMMPKKDGLSVCKELRQDSNFRKKPIIILTARRNSEDGVRAIIDSGANTFITKPYGPQQLLATVEKYLTKSTADENKS